MHNGHVRQGWILLINSTGYIVPSLVDIPCVYFLRIPSSIPEDALLRPGLRSSTFHSLLPPARAVSFCRDELCRRVPAAGVRRYYITLIMRACAKGGTGPISHTSRSTRPGRGSQEGDTMKQTRNVAPENYRETITELSIPRRYWYIIDNEEESTEGWLLYTHRTGITTICPWIFESFFGSRSIFNVTTDQPVPWNPMIPELQVQRDF